MPTYTKSGFKEVFLKRESHINDTLGEIDEILDELDTLGAEYNLFDAELKTLSQKVQTIVTKAKQDDNKAGYKEATKALKDLEEKAKKALVKGQIISESHKIKIDDPDLPKGLHLHPASIRGFDKMSVQEKTAAQQKVVAKIKEGKQLCDQLLSDQFDPTTMEKPDRQQISSLMWYIKAMSEKQAQEPFAKGATTIPDPDHKIRKFLDGCSDIYVRKSTHITEQPNDKVTNATGAKSARGIDFYDGKNDMDLLLPYGMNTLLMQSVSAGDDQNPRLYLKMETETAYGSGGQHGVDAPQDRPKQKTDSGGLLKHGMNIFTKTDKGMSNYREQTPKTDVLAYENLMKTIKDETALQILQSKYRKQTKLDKASGVFGNQVRICDMIKATEEILARKDDDQIDANTIHEVQQLQDQLRQKYPDADSRFGGEVVLSKDTLVDTKPAVQVNDLNEDLNTVLDRCKGSPEQVVKNLMDEDDVMNLLTHQEKNSLLLVGYYAMELTKVVNTYGGDDASIIAASTLRELKKNLNILEDTEVGLWLEKELEPLLKQLPEDQG